MRTLSILAALIFLTTSASASTPAASKDPAASALPPGITLPLEKSNPVTLPKFTSAPLIDGSLDDERVKREFWRAFRSLGDWYEDFPPY